MNEFLDQFVIELRELVEQASDDLLALERDPADRDRLDSLFRAFHTLKGGAGIVEFSAMARVLHAAEDVLAAIRTGDGALTGTLISHCLATLDQVLRWLGAIEAAESVPEVADAAVDALAARFAGARAAVPEAEGAGPAPADAPRQPDLPAEAEQLLREQLMVVSDTTPDGLAGRLAAARRVVANVLRQCGRADAAAALEREDGGAAFAAGLRAVLDSPDAARPTAPEPGLRALRVDVQRIDALVQLAGELTVAKNAIGHAAAMAQAGGASPTLAGLLKQQHAGLDRLVGELQRSVLGIRVLPLRTVFSRFPRLVREMAAAQGKAVRLETAGEDTEADKAVVEALFEPLLHLVRNALAHGVEQPAQRQAAGKPAAASVRLSAGRLGEHVVVEVADDGGGIDLARVREVALRRRLASEAALAAMADDELAQLVFAPGFSTAGQVTDLAGRGVGMDAVQFTAARMGGQARVESRLGQGTTVRLTLPLSLMMSRVMTVEAAGQAFGIPLDAVMETASVPAARLARLGAAEAVVLRGRTLPVIDLAGALGLERPARRDGEARLVVVAQGALWGAIQVDSFGRREDIMLKPLDGLLAGAHGVAGATLLGDGRVLIVLDMQTLLE